MGAAPVDAAEGVGAAVVVGAGRAVVVGRAVGENGDGPGLAASSAAVSRRTFPKNLSLAARKRSSKGLGPLAGRAAAAGAGVAVVAGAAVCGAGGGMLRDLESRVSRSTFLRPDAAPAPVAVGAGAAATAGAGAGAGAGAATPRDWV